jgi:RNA polymerase sigma-70 factor, ECF subfamily
VSKDGSRSPRGREQQFESIFEACYPRVLGYAIRRTADRSSAEEAVSDTFLVAWRRFEDIPAEPLPWLLGVARKVVANQRRAAGRRAPDGPLIPLEAVPDPERGASIADRVTDRQAFAEAFDSLSPGDREVLALTSWDGLAPREAASVLETSPAAFSLRLHRARKRLLKELEKRGHSFGERSARPVSEPRPDANEA